MIDSVRGSGYDGLINEPYVTFATALTASSVGKAVKPSASYSEPVGITVSLVTEGDQVAGRLTRVESDGYCSVQQLGFCTLPFVAGATPSVGDKIVGGTTDGSVKTDNDKGRHLVYSIDSTNLLVLVKLD